MLTDADLARMVARRREIWEAMPIGPYATLASLEPDERARADAASAEFRRLDREITAALRDRDAPVRLERSTLYLTRDGLGFIEVDDRSTRSWNAGNGRLERYVYAYPARR